MGAFGVGFGLGVRARRMRGATLPAANALLIAGTNSRTGDTATSPSGGRNEFVISTTHILGFACTALSPLFMQWYVTPTGEFNPASGCSIVKMAMLWYDGGTKRTCPVTFGGSRTVVMGPGSEISADELTPAMFGRSDLAAFPTDAMFQLRYIGSWTGEMALGTPATANPSTTGFTASGSNYNNAQQYLPANRNDAVDSLGDMPNPSGQVGMNNIGLPTMFLGRPVDAATAKAILVVGDSISVGLSDGANPMKTMAGYGYFDRGAVASNGYTGAIAIAHSSRQSQRMTEWMSTCTRCKRLLGYASVVIAQHGTNDISAGGGGPANDYQNVNQGSPLANMQKTFGDFYALARSYPSVKRVYQCTIGPRPTSSSDSWATKAGQSVAAGWATGGLRDTFEAWVATKVSDATLNGIIDVRTPIADAADNHYFLTNGSANTYTSDGTHPSSAGHALIAPAARSAMTAISLP